VAVSRGTPEPGESRFFLVVAHMLFLGLCALAGLGVGDGIKRYLVAAFVARTGGETATALELVDAFVATYAAERERLAASTAAVPASFRAHALARFAQRHGSEQNLRVAMVGMPGR